MTGFPDLVLRYRSELRRLVARRRRLDAEIAAKRQVLRDLEAAIGKPTSTPARRGRITQAEGVRRVLATPDLAMTATEIYAAAREAGAGGTERSLRNLLSRLVKTGELVADRRSFPQRYSRRASGPESAAGPASRGPGG
jgi:hypothetical protein